MKLLRFGEPGKEKPAVMLNNKTWDVSSKGEDYNEKFFETGAQQVRHEFKGGLNLHIRFSVLTFIEGDRNLRYLQFHPDALN